LHKVHFTWSIPSLHQLMAKGFTLKDNANPQLAIWWHVAFKLAAQAIGHAKVFAEASIAGAELPTGTPAPAVRKISSINEPSAAEQQDLATETCCKRQASKKATKPF
ncbi:unnamed protein product, partial [Symbiodinium microadriaticum]